MTFVIDDSCIHIQKVNRSKDYSIAALGASRFRHGHIIVHIVSSRFEHGDEVIQSLNLRTDRILPRDGVGPQRPVAGFPCTNPVGDGRATGLVAGPTRGARKLRAPPRRRLSARRRAARSSPPTR